MDALLPPVKPALILVAIWATFLLTNLASSNSESMTLLLALVGFLAAYVFYPSAVVLGSKTVGATAAQQRFTVIGAVVFFALMLSRPYDASTRDRLTAILALAALLVVWYQFVAALSAAESNMHAGTRGRTVTLWLGLLLFPFLGAIYVHARYRRLVNSAKAT